MADKTTLEKAKEIAQKVWDSVPTREEVWDSVPTREDILNLPKNIWDHVPTQTELQKTFDDIYRGAKDFDPVEFLGTVVGYTLEKGSDARESFNRLLKHDPRVAALFFDKIEGKTFDEASERAKKEGLRTFIWGTNGKVYSTEYKGTPKEEMDLYNIVYQQTMDPAWWQKRMANNLAPFSYENPVRRFFWAVVFNKKDNEGLENSSRMDYFRFYMGRSQTNNTLGISDYIPTDVGEINGKKLPKATVYYRDNNYSDVISKYWAVFAKHLLNEANHKESRFDHKDMGHFKMCLGQDDKGYYICYHDTWDLAPTGSNADFGKPFELYDRIYFDPEKIDDAFQEQWYEYYECLNQHDIPPAGPRRIEEKTQLGEGEEEIKLYNLNEGRLCVLKNSQGRRVSETIKDKDGNIIETTEYVYDDIKKISSGITKDKNGKIIRGYGPAYEEAVRQQEKQEPENSNHEMAHRQREIDNGKGIDEDLKALANDGKGWKAEEKVAQTPTKRRADKTENKGYYGNRPGGIDDTIAKIDTQERVKINSVKSSKLEQS